MIQSFLQKTRHIVRQKIIDPIFKSQSPVKEVSWGVAVGMFFGLTPTMGIQMYIVTGIWLILRFFPKGSFNLPVACAMVWISNPLTVIPMYYVFFVTGDLLLHGTSQAGSFVWFRSKIEQIQEDFQGIEFIIKILEFLIVDLGYPMLVGSLLYAIPIAFGSFFITKRLLTRRGKTV